MAATPVLETGVERRVGSSPTLSTMAHALKRGFVRTTYNNMSARRARITTKLPLADTLDFCRIKSDMWLAV